MELIHYQEKSIRTLKRLESKDLDIVHMKLGLVTEIGELADAYKRFIAYDKAIDIVNIKEEIGDLMWYLCNLGNVLEIEFSNFENHFNHEKKMKCLEVPSEEMILIINIKISDLIDSTTVFEFNLFTIYYSLMFLCLKNGINFNECLQMNYDKLFARYPEKFTNEQALNRDLEKERDELEKTQPIIDTDLTFDKPKEENND